MQQQVRLQHVVMPALSQQQKPVHENLGEKLWDLSRSSRSFQFRSDICGGASPNTMNAYVMAVISSTEKTQL